MSSQVSSQVFSQVHFFHSFFHRVLKLQYFYKFWPLQNSHFFTGYFNITCFFTVFSQENHRFLSNSGSSQCNQDSLAAPITSPHPPSINEPPNPGTASNQRPANGVRQQSLAGAAGDQPDNEPQNPVLNSGTTADDFTDVSHTSSTNNEDLADYTAPAADDTDHNFQRTGEASSLDHSSGFPQQENSLTNHLIQVESEHSATGGASDQPDETVTENFELYLGE